MEGQTVVVFGGGSGIGEATARLAARLGARVVIVGRDAAKLAAARGRIEGQVATASVDATQRDAVDRFFAELGPFDHLVLSLSGSKGAGAFAGLDIESVRQGFEAKLFPQLTVAQAALPTLTKGGSITFVSAGSGRSAIPGTSGLAAINAAVDAVVPILALELAPTRVNSVSPGIIDTPWWDGMPAAAKDSYFEHARSTLPVRRVGKPEDVGSVLVMLMQNPFVTGAVFDVDGGGRLV